MRLFISTLILGAGTALTSAGHAMLPTPTTQPTPIISLTPTTPLQSPLSGATQELTSRIFAYLVHHQNGQETLVPITYATPVLAGSIVEYQGFFHNISNQRIRSATIGLDVPMGLELISMSDNATLGSVDGQHYSRMPLRTQMNGQISEIPLSFYRGLRWQVTDIGLGGTAVVKYRARVL